VVAGHVEDVTGRQEVVEELRRQEARLRAILDGHPHAALVVRAGRVFFASARARALLGRKDPGLEGALLLEIVHPGDHGAMISLVRGEGGSGERAIRLLGPGGVVETRISASPIFLDGEPAVLLAIRVPRSEAPAEAIPGPGDVSLCRSLAGEILGRWLGPYRVLERIAVGGMAEVYLAEDPRVERQVALKILSPDLARDPRQVERFAREARALAAVQHPNVLTLYEAGERNGRYYLATELVAGETLRSRTAHRRLAVAEVADLGLKLASALAAVHRAGLVHQDVKPENVMIRTDGQVKLLDFGIARRVGEPAAEPSLGSWPDAPTTDTLPDLVLGTPEYMSPEQVEGAPVDGRADLFSLGALLYEVATGRVPFRGFSPREVAEAVVACEPIHPSCFAPDLPPGLARVLLRALRKNPEERYASAEALAADLSGVLGALPAAPPLEDEAPPLAPPRSPPGAPTAASRPALLRARRPPPLPPAARRASPPLPLAASRRRRLAQIEAAGK
jgi:serine/threonine protein kinase